MRSGSLSNDIAKNWFPENFSMVFLHLAVASKALGPRHFLNLPSLISLHRLVLKVSSLVLKFSRKFPSLKVTRLLIELNEFLVRESIAKTKDKLDRKAHSDIDFEKRAVRFR